MQGIINFLKPPGMTSHDMVALTRRKLKIKKVGHTGTLDPMAAGVLPVCVGKATKIIEYIQDDQKKYRAEMLLGQETDTQDRWGIVLHENEPELDALKIKEALLSFKGEIDQIPPMYSALKVNGRKLYELAREGQVIERPSRKRTIYDIEPVVITPPRLMFDVTCSKGTYIRTLCHDLGLKLNTYGHMTFLLRSATGDFNLENAVTIEAFQEASIEKIQRDYLMPLDFPFSYLPSMHLPAWVEKKIMHGQKVNLLEHTTSKYQQGQKVKVYGPEAFIGLAEMQGKYLVLLKRFK